MSSQDGGLKAMTVPWLTNNYRGLDYDLLMMGHVLSSGQISARNCVSFGEHLNTHKV